MCPRESLPHAQVFDALDALRYVARAPLAARPTTISAAALATHAKAGGVGGLHRVRGEGRGGQRGAALVPARPTSPCVGPAQRQRSFATIPRRSRAMVATPSPSSALSSARRRCARLRRERARPSRRGLEFTACTASAVAPRAARRTSRPRHAPEPRGSPPDPSSISFTKAGQPSLAATRPWGWRSDAAPGSPYSRRVGPAPPGAPGPAGGAPSGGDVERRQRLGRGRGAGLWRARLA